MTQRFLFDAVLAFTWRALAPYRLSDADRKDVAQNVALVVLRRRASYRASRGKPEQWLSGILRLEVKKFLRNEHKHPWPSADDERSEPEAHAATPEEEVSMHDLAEHMCAMLPDEERRAVILVEIDGLTFRQVAEREGISPSTAFDRHRRGMAALRDAAGREDRAECGVLVFPLVAGSSEPPPDFAERAWQRAVVELGLHEGPPPDSGVAPIVPSPAEDVVPPSGSRRLRRLPTPPKLGALAAAGVACALGGTILGRCTADRPREERPAAIVVEAPPSVREGTVAKAIAATVSEAAPVAEARPAAIVAVKDDGEGDRDLLRRARIAIEQGDAARALALLAQGRSTRFAATRSRLRESALSLQADTAGP